MSLPLSSLSVSATSMGVQCPCPVWKRGQAGRLHRTNGEVGGGDRGPDSDSHLDGCPVSVSGVEAWPSGEVAQDEWGGRRGGQGT